MGGVTAPVEVLAGRGIPTSFARAVTGRLCAISQAADVIALLEELERGGLKSPIALVRDAGGTTIGPLLGELTAVVSTAGGLGSHIALLCKEYGCPCVVGTDFDELPSDRALVRIDPEGAVWIVQEA